ncbi:MAG TPA: glycosyl transferase family 2, partial [Dehalococcoidia bacterium]|nr:glycosyl transferase family 2 [Dehalococcoidia bacterium]
MKLSIVIPCFNESANLESLLSRCHEVGQDKDIEFIIVDNGSNDNTGEILSNLLPLYSSV